MSATGYLTTHVLDTARGCPAEGIKIALYRVSGNSHTKLVEMDTNSDGRTDSPILPAEKFKPGNYELIFFTGEYLKDYGLVDGDSDTPLFRLAALGWPTWLLYLLVAAQLAFAFALLSPATRRVGGLGLLVLAAVAFGARFAYREYEALAGAGGQILIIIVVLYTTRRVAGSQG